MSTFKVKLQNVKQGLLDLDPSTDNSNSYGAVGDQEDVSLQRQIWVAGPGRTYRLLKDGEQFTDCNYWKRFAYPQMDYEFAFIEVVSDDGSVYSDIPEENTFAVGDSGTLAANASTTTDFVDTHGGPAQFLQVQNTGSNPLTGTLNGDATVSFTLAAGETQIFNQGDLMITSLKIESALGTDYNFIASVRSVCNS